MANQIKGKISQIIGPVIDVVFTEADSIPNIYDALVITKDNGDKVVLEVEQHIGEDSVRCIAMDATDGLQRGQEVISIVFTIPFGSITNVHLQAIDEFSSSTL